MMKNFKAMCLAGLLAVGCMGNAVAEEDGGPFATENFSATLTFTSDYVFRGISFSDSLPALQGSFDWGYGNWFAGWWSSSLADTDGSGYELESDFYAGYANSFAGFDWWVMPIYYHFWGFDDDDFALATGTPTADLDEDVFEVWVDVTRSFADAPLSPSFHLLYAYTPDYFFESGDGHYVKGDITLSLPAGFSLNAGYGVQTVDGGDYGDPSVFGTGGWTYGHWEVGLSRDFLGFGLDLRYHDTSDDEFTDDLVTDFLVTPENSDDRLVFTISRSF